MTKNDYEVIAKVFYNTRPYLIQHPDSECRGDEVYLGFADQWRWTLAEMITTLKVDNPRFDVDKFTTYAYTGSY